MNAEDNELERKKLRTAFAADAIAQTGIVNAKEHTQPRALLELKAIYLNMQGLIQKVEERLDLTVEAREKQLGLLQKTKSFCV